MSVAFIGQQSGNLTIEILWGGEFDKAITLMAFLSLNPARYPPVSENN